MAAARYMPSRHQTDSLDRASRRGVPGRRCDLVGRGPARRVCLATAGNTQEALRLETFDTHPAARPASRNVTATGRVLHARPRPDTAQHDHDQQRYPRTLPVFPRTGCFSLAQRLHSPSVCVTAGVKPELDLSFWLFRVLGGCFVA
jgi:hypothetical protein